MIHIFHGDNQNQSRASYNNYLDTHPDSNLFRADSKDFDLDQVTLFLVSTSFLDGKKVLAFSNFFSTPKTQQDKMVKLFLVSDPIDILIWQDKKLSATQLKSLPGSKIEYFPINKNMFVCLNSIKPGNSRQFLKLLESTLKQEPYDLFLYLIKGHLRKQISGYSQLNPARLKQAYLNLIELDYLNKSGLLTTPKEIALERIMVKLLEN